MRRWKARPTGDMRLHVLSVFLFELAAVTTLYSWEMQKEKAAKRFRSLQKRDLETYAAQECRPNHPIDRIAAMLLLVGLVLEFLIFARWL